MANEQNLKPFEKGCRSNEEAVKNGRKGGINSGVARKRKADLRKIAQQVLDGTYTDKQTGLRMTGEELVLNSIVANLSPNSIHWGKAMDLLVKLTGMDKSREEKQLLKAQVALLKAKAELMNGNDDLLLQKLDEVLKQIGE